MVKFAEISSLTPPHGVMLSCTLTLALAFAPQPSTMPLVAGGTLRVRAAAATASMATTRRSVLGIAAVGAFGTLLPPSAAFAADTEAALQAELLALRKALDLPALNALIDEEKWDAVRSVLKVAPVNTAWEQSQKLKNPLKRLADIKDDVELFEVVDDIAAALQLADQYLYSNTFIYTQPGNGKVKFKEPKQQLQIAVDKLNTFIN